MPIGKKLRDKQPDTSDSNADVSKPTEEQEQFIKSHKFPTKRDMEIKAKEDSNYNRPDDDGKWSKLPRQKSNIGVYHCCMAQGHECNPTHTKDESTGITRYWCIECGWELSLKQSDAYMNKGRAENAY